MTIQDSQPLRILHLEDSPRDAELIRERLLALDQLTQLDLATNESTFTAFLEERQYDLILCDYHLPSYDAPRALRVVQALSPNSPFICISGAIGEEKAVELLKLGTTDYVLKDKLDKLPLAISRALAEVKERQMRREAEQNLLQSLREKETLLRELYHRTKNTMEVIRGLLVIRAAEFPDNTELQQLVSDTEHRIQTIGLVHQMLYRAKDLSLISIPEYVRELASLILRSFSIDHDRINLELQLDEQSFLLDTAIPFGLILNELMCNSLKHAFPDKRRGIISISLSKGEAGRSTLTYSDNGVGAAEDFVFRNQTTLGLKLIYSIGEQQLRGKVHMENANGIHCSIEFSNQLYQARV